MRALYVSQNGMAENLGQSQVLPYLRGLARRGVDIDLVSFELTTLAPDAHAKLANSLARDGLRWHPMVRSMGTGLPTKIKEATLGAATALRSALERPPDIIHGRSYFATAICDAVGIARRKSNIVFDCRGMIGDEYVDCGHWTTSRLEYRLVKAYERRLFRGLDGVVVLTKALAKWLRDHDRLGRRPHLEVIPCCVDRTLFKPSEIARQRIRRELRIENHLVIVYSGSLGTWYLEAEMARFSTMLRARAAAAGQPTTFLCLTPSPAESLQSRLVEEGFSRTDIIVRKVAPSEMTDYLSAGDIGLSFIQSCFSKKGSSPTKVAEYLACGNIAVVNGDIGDQADLTKEPQSCVVLNDWSNAAFQEAASATFALATRSYAERARDTVLTATQHFDLERVGVARYAALYESLVRRGRPSHAE